MRTARRARLVTASRSPSFSPVRAAAALLLLAAALAWAGPARATSAPPAVTARAVLVADGATGEVLHARNADRRLAMASITKLMTAIVALEHARPGELVRVRPQAAAIGEATAHLRAGERIRVRDLLAAALIASANDAAWALAAHVGRGNPGAFVRLMNAKAKSLGLRRTRFVRPDGLDVPGHYSTARDVLALARAAMRKPVLRRLARMRAATIAGGRRVETWNDLLSSFPGLVGVKTGHTLDAGWCQVAAARREGVAVYAVILGSPSRQRRNADLAELLEWGFDRYATVRVVAPGRVYARAGVPFSDERLPLVADRPARVAVRLGRSLLERVVAPAAVDPPVARGERLGEIRVYAGRRLLARRPLVAGRDAEAARFRERAGWYAGRALEHAGAMLAGALSALP